MIKSAIRNVGKENFDIREFERISKESGLSQIDILNDLLYYVKNKLTYLGEGSSRIVYIYNNSKVLKLAMNNFGIHQNRGEANISERSNVLAPKVFVVGNNNYYLISELVRPVTNTGEFLLLSNTSWIWIRFVNDLNSYNEDNEFESEDTFTNKVLDFIDKNQLLIGDVTCLEHWGVTATDTIED